MYFKEARKFGERDANGVAAQDRLNHQARNLSCLVVYGSFPNVITHLILDSSLILAMKPVSAGSNLLDKLENEN